MARVLEVAAPMAEPQDLKLTAAGAASFLTEQLSLAEKAIQQDRLDAALDSYVRALGLALQLGPASAEQAVSSILEAARELASRQYASSLSALGPALVGLIQQMEDVEALPATATMQAWARFVEGLGALIGQLGLVQSLPTENRSGMLASAHAHAALLDDVTADRFRLTEWVDGIAQ